MGQATRTTKLLLDLGRRDQGGANTDKRAALDATALVLNQARAFYIDFFLAHADKLAERVPYYSEKHLEMRERAHLRQRTAQLGRSLHRGNGSPPASLEGVELQRTLSRDAFHLPQKRDQRCYRQSARVSVESRQLAQDEEEKGQARAAWSHRPPDALPGHL